VSGRIVLVVAALSLALAQIPAFLGSEKTLTPLVVMVFVACVAWGVPRQPRRSFANPIAVTIFAYALLTGIALYRGAQHGVYGSTSSAFARTILYLCMVALGIVLVTTARTTKERQQGLVAVAASPMIYVVTNVLLHLAGFQAPRTLSSVSEGRPAELLGVLGVPLGRVRFPLATSINLFSVVVAAALVGAVLLWLRGRFLRGGPALGVAAACAYCLLVGDSRAAIAVAVVVVVAFLLWPRFEGAAGVAALIPLFPLMVIAGIGVFANSGLGAVLSRNGDDFASGSDRFYIWHAAYDVLKHFDPEHIIGFGAGGQITSGASLHYAYLFGLNPDASSIQTHSAVLQTILDSGYLGLAIFVLAAVQTALILQRTAKDDPRSPAVALLGMLLVVLLSGATEVAPSYYSQEAFLFTLLTMGAASGLAVVEQQCGGSVSRGSLRGRQAATPVAAS
jgi:O-antigen ligase